MVHRCAWRDSPEFDFLFHRHALGEISGLVDVGAAVHGDVVGQQLKRDAEHDGGEKMGSFGECQHTG